MIFHLFYMLGLYLDMKNSLKIVTIGRMKTSVNLLNKCAVLNKNENAKTALNYKVLTQIHGRIGTLQKLCHI